jgi:hypothetical protein
MSVKDALLGKRFPDADYIVLGGKVSPGRATIDGAARVRTYDIQKGYGTTGAFVRYTGDGLAKFRVRIDLWTKDDFAEWNSFAKAVLTKPPSQLRPSALKIKHPLLNLPPLEIDTVVVADVSQFRPDEHGLYSCTIDLIQYREVKIARATAKAPIPAEELQQVAAESARKREIREKTAEVQRLAGS